MKFSRCGFAFAKRSGAMKVPVGLLSNRTVLHKQDGGASPRQVTIKEKYRPCSIAMDFVGRSRRQNESGVLRGGKFFRGLFLTEVVGLTVITTTFCGSVQNEHDHILWMALEQSTKSVGFVTENIMVHKARQDGFVNFIEGMQ